MSANNGWSTKVGAKFLADLVMYSRLSADIPLDFQDSTWVVLIKYLMYFLACINTK